MENCRLEYYFPMFIQKSKCVVDSNQECLCVCVLLLCTLNCFTSIFVSHAIWLSLSLSGLCIPVMVHGQTDFRVLCTRNTCTTHLFDFPIFHSIRSVSFGFISFSFTKLAENSLCRVIIYYVLFFRVSSSFYLWLCVRWCALNRAVYVGAVFLWSTMNAHGLFVQGDMAEVRLCV